MNNPHVIACVDSDAGDRAEDPLIGQGLGPMSIDRESRHLRTILCRRHRRQ